MSAFKVPLRPLGKDGPRVPALGFGLMELSYQAYGTTPSEEQQFAILDRALELGATFWDTSDLYGDNEELLGKWFQRTGKRDQIFLASKFGFIGGSLEVDSSASHCKKACENSLKRLGIDSIDLYYMHMANPETPIEETMRALAELKEEGKIKHIGLSMVSSTTLRRAYKIAPVAAVQSEYSVVSRDVEGAAGTDLLAGNMSRAGSRGSDVGDERDMRVKVMPRFLPENREQNVKAVVQFKELAERKGCGITQLALAWLLRQGADIFPIPGTKRLKYLEDNWKALGISLTAEEDAEIKAFGDSVRISGAAVPEKFASYRFRDTSEVV